MSASLTARIARHYSLAGLGRWLRLCDEELAGAKHPRPEVVEARAAVVAELAARGVEGVA